MAMYGLNSLEASSASSKGQWSSWLRVPTKRQSLLLCQQQSTALLTSQMVAWTSLISTGNSMWSHQLSPRSPSTAFKSASKVCSSTRESVTTTLFASLPCPSRTILTWTPYRHSSACSRLTPSLSLTWMYMRAQAGTMRLSCHLLLISHWRRKIWTSCFQAWSILTARTSKSSLSIKLRTLGISGADLQSPTWLPLQQSTYDSGLSRRQIKRNLQLNSTSTILPIKFSWMKNPTWGWVLWLVSSDYMASKSSTQELVCWIQIQSDWSLILWTQWLLHSLISSYRSGKSRSLTQCSADYSIWQTYIWNISMDIFMQVWLQCMCNLHPWLHTQFTITHLPLRHMTIHCPWTVESMKKKKISAGTTVITDTIVIPHIMDNSIILLLWSMMPTMTIHISMVTIMITVANTSMTSMMTIQVFSTMDTTSSLSKTESSLWNSCSQWVSIQLRPIVNHILIEIIS